MAAQSGGTCVLRLHYIIGPTGSIMNMMMMIDLEKAYGRVPCQEVWRCMSEKGVPEKCVMIVQDMYERARARLKSRVGLTDMIPVGVWLYQLDLP